MTTNPEQTHQTRLFWIIEGLIALSFTFESVVEIFLIPANIFRWLLVIAVIDGTALITFLISRAGYIRQAGLIFVGALLALFTGLAITENGVRAPTIDIAYLVIIIASGLILGERAGFITGVICSLTLLGLTVAGDRRLLPGDQVHRTIWATLEADIFYLAIVIGLQYLAIHTIKDALDQAHRELMERRRLEGNLRQAEEERAQTQMRVELSHLLSEQLEKERVKIARDLHDGPVQDLIGATFSLQNLIEDATDEKYRQNLEAVQATLHDQISSLRAFAGELRSPTLVKFGLSSAIREHLDGFHEKYPEIDVQFAACPNDTFLPEAARYTLFRIYQEVMHNIIRHAHATQISIQVATKDHQVSMEISDNGVGFTPPKEWMDLARHGHLGLVGMRERAETIGGQLEIISEENQGMTVQVVLPIQETPEIDLRTTGRPDEPG